MVWDEVGGEVVEDGGDGEEEDDEEGDDEAGGDGGVDHTLEMVDGAGLGAGRERGMTGKLS